MPRKNQGEQPNSDGNIPEALPVTPEEIEKAKKEGRYIDTSKEAGDWLKNNEGLLEFHKKEETKNGQKIKNLKNRLDGVYQEATGEKPMFTKEERQRLKNLNDAMLGKDKDQFEGALREVAFDDLADVFDKLGDEKVWELIDKAIELELEKGGNNLNEDEKKSFSITEICDILGVSQDSSDQDIMNTIDKMEDIAEREQKRGEYDGESGNKLRELYSKLIDYGIINSSRNLNSKLPEKLKQLRNSN